MLQQSLHQQAPMASAGVWTGVYVCSCRPCQPPQALPRVVAGCGAAAVSLFIPLLPSWASEFLDDTYIDPSLADSPDILGTLLIVVVTYFTVMMLYLWLSSFLDEVRQAPVSNNLGAAACHIRWPQPWEQQGQLLFR